MKILGIVFTEEEAELQAYANYQQNIDIVSEKNMQVMMTGQGTPQALNHFGIDVRC